jgi:hypothetical protein
VRGHDGGRVGAGQHHVQRHTQAGGGRRSEIESDWRLEGE